MSRPPPWPALAGPPEWLGTRLATRRGIWGKVPGAASDYRWIARSRHFAAGREDLAQTLRIGSEDQPIRASLWRRLPDRYLAASVYPSRARDSAGRPALIEKQVVEVPGPAAVPACATALLLLPEISTHDDRDWWERRSGEPWHVPDHSLDIPDAECPAPRLDTTALEGAVGAGLDRIRRRIPAAALYAFYLDLLAGEPLPARLAVSGPLPPEAVAALLLPLPRYWADRVSIAGGLAGHRFQRTDLSESWDAVATPHPPDDPSPPPDVEPEPGIEDLARAIGEAVAGGDPSRLLALYRRRETGYTAAALPTPVPVERMPLGPVLPGIEPPAPDAPAVIRLLHAFACAVDQRLLDLDAIARALDADGMPGPEGRQVRLLCAWPAAVAAARPDGVDADEWTVKCDQLRAAAWCLFPAPARTREPGLPQTPAVPALLPAVLCGNAELDANLAALGPDAFAAALDQGLRCPDRALAGRLAHWAADWCRAPFAPPWGAGMTARIQAIAGNLRTR